jgi:hypothetical protein
MAILKRLNNPDPDDDNNKIKVSSVQFFLGANDSAVICYQCGRTGKQGGFRPSETLALTVADADWTTFNDARTKNNQKSAEDWLILKGIASV